MKSFLKLVLDKDFVYSQRNVISGDDSGWELNFIKLLQKIIFKHDVKAEFDNILKSVCSSEPFTVKNDMIKKLIVALNSVLLSESDDKFKITVFRCVFQAFTLSCKVNEKLPALQFFVVLAHLLGMDELFIPNENSSHSDPIINSENFKQSFSVKISKPSKISYLILRELLVCFSTHSLAINLSEESTYQKWLQKLIKNIANTQPFQSTFLEIFSACIDIDIKLIEKNLTHIIKSILNQRPPLNENFNELYRSFLECSLKMSSKFQRSVKFLRNYLLSVKTTPTVLAKEVILPSNFVNEFSKAVLSASTQQSLMLFDNLILNLDECVTIIAENSSGSLFMSIISDLLVTFLKEVKIFAPNTSANTLKMLVAKLNSLIEVLEKFGNFVFNNNINIGKAQNVVIPYLQVCLYCGEVQGLIDCYKDSVLKPEELTNSAVETKWSCSLSLDQWNNLVSVVLNSNLEMYNPICFQLSLHRLRMLKLHRKTLLEESTLKMILSQFELKSKKFNLFEQVTPEDVIIMISFLTPGQAKIVAKKVFDIILESDGTEWKSWLCDSYVQENFTLIVNLFSELLQRTGSVLGGNKVSSKCSWLSNEYFDSDNNINKENLKDLPTGINGLLKNWKKIRKSVGKSFSEEEKVTRAVEVFALLPVNHLAEDYRQLGLSFAVSVAVILCHDENAVRLPLESVCRFLTSDADASLCFDVGLCLKWLSELSFESEEANDRKMKVVETLVRSSPNMKLGLFQLGKMIEDAETLRQESPLKMLESRVVVYQELGKCWQRAKKRKADNDLIGNFRKKLAKVISGEAKELEGTEIEPDNCKLLFRIFAIELHKAMQLNEENELLVLMERKFPSYFDFAVKTMKKAYDEPSSAFLSFVLASTPQLKKFLPEGSFLKIWKCLRQYDKGNWRLFCSHSDDDEFQVILSDLLKISKKFFVSESDQPSSNCFEVWPCFFELSSESKRRACQLLLQDLFNFFLDCDLLLRGLPMSKRISLIKFCSFCASSEKVILTSHMLDTVIHLMVEFLDDSSSVEDFHDLFAAEVDAALAVLLRQFMWSKNKVHLSFVLFRSLLGSLTRRCDVSRQVNNDDVTMLSTCAFVMEKWVKLMVTKKKDFARTAAYFIVVIISAIASTTILPAIKFHLINCINHFLDISDSHTVSYLMRVLKPGYQQVFSTIYQQFKKYHKYTGKI